MSQPQQSRGELDLLIAKAQANLASQRLAEPAYPTAGPEGRSTDRPQALTWTEWVEWIQWIEWTQR